MKNNSEYTLHEFDDKGELHTFAPGDTLPSWVKVDNPYVKGEAEDQDDSDDEDAPRRGRPRKAANS